MMKTAGPLFNGHGIHRSYTLAPKRKHTHTCCCSLNIAMLELYHPSLLFSLLSCPRRSERLKSICSPTYLLLAVLTNLIVQEYRAAPHARQ